MDDLRRHEIDHNYDYFQRNLKAFLCEHEGKYVLLRQKETVGYFDSVGDAYRDGLARFPDQLFSIQLITKEPVELGNWSVAVA